MSMHWGCVYINKWHLCEKKLDLKNPWCQISSIKWRQFLFWLTQWSAFFFSPCRLFLSLVTFLSHIQSITDESRGSIRRKSYSSPQSIGQDVQALLPNDYAEEVVAGHSTGWIFLFHCNTWSATIENWSTK